VSSSDRGGTPLSTLVDALTGSSTDGGMGALLPAILILSAIGGGAIAVLRHRAR
jgi:hypothetical protein